MSDTPSHREELVRAVADALATHYPTRGMRVAMGETCECGYWNGNEDRRLDRDKPLPLPLGRDGLNIHRANLAVDTILEILE